ncbi:MAG: hypothetical protein AAFV53_02020, partial [Myxococcota bacterium]
MNVSPFQTAPGWQRLIRSFAIPASIVFHAGIAWLMLQERPPPEEKPEAVWVEMAVVEKPPPPPPPEPKTEPEPKPKPKPKPRPKPKPKPVDFQDTTPEPPTEPPPTDRPPERNKNLRRVQGLSAESFANDGASTLSARAGTTLQTAATDEVMTVDEAANSTAVSFSAATTQPRLKSCPPLVVPDTVREANLEGTVKAAIDIDDTGKVID